MQWVVTVSGKCRGAKNAVDYRDPHTVRSGFVGSFRGGPYVLDGLGAVHRRSRLTAADQVFWGPNTAAAGTCHSSSAKATDRCTFSSGHSTMKSDKGGPSDCYPLRRPALRDPERAVKSAAVHSPKMQTRSVCFSILSLPTFYKTHVN